MAYVDVAPFLKAFFDLSISSSDSNGPALLKRVRTL